MSKFLIEIRKQRVLKILTEWKRFGHKVELEKTWNTGHSNLLVGTEPGSFFFFNFQQLFGIDTIIPIPQVTVS